MSFSLSGWMLYMMWLVVEFVPTTTGTHTLRIEAASMSNDYEYVGIALW